MSLNRLSVGAVIGSALLVAVAMPAAAAPHDLAESLRIEPYTWTLGSGEFGVEGASYSSGGLVYSDAADSSAFSVWSENEAGESTAMPTVFACAGADLAASADESGDFMVTCDEQLAATGVALDGEARLYAEGDLVRMVYSVSNPTDSVVGFSWAYSVDFFGGAGLRATSTAPSLGLNVATPDDSWVYNAEANSLNSLLAWGLPGASVPSEWVREYDNSTVLLVSDRDLDGEQTELAPGATMTFAFFHKMDPAGTTAARSEFFDVVTPAATDALQSADLSTTDLAIQAATAEFESFSGRLSRGIPSETVVANWQAAPAPEAPQLAETGTNSAAAITVGIIAGVLLVAGAALLVVRRRSARPRP